jgi:hypothetical protein
MEQDLKAALVAALPPLSAPGESAVFGGTAVRVHRR